MMNTHLVYSDDGTQTVRQTPVKTPVNRALFAAVTHCHSKPLPQKKTQKKTLNEDKLDHLSFVQVNDIAGKVAGSYDKICNVMMRKLGVVVAKLAPGPDFVERLESALGVSMNTIHVPKHLVVSDQLCPRRSQLCPQPLSRSQLLDSLQRGWAEFAILSYLFEQAAPACSANEFIELVKQPTALAAVKLLEWQALNNHLRATWSTRWGEASHQKTRASARLERCGLLLSKQKGYNVNWAAHKRFSGMLQHFADFRAGRSFVAGPT
jgi:hypothetical protein